MLLEMVVKGLTLDPLTNTPIIILRDTDGNRALPIWVGIFEANAIALELEKIETPRPMTHDLLKNALDTLEAKVTRIVVNELRDSTYYAYIDLNVNGSQIQLDSRPSDAIALALRVNAPIFVEQEVLENSRGVEIQEETDESERLKEWLKNLKPEDFGKYKM